MQGYRERCSSGKKWDSRLILQNGRKEKEFDILHHIGYCDAKYHMAPLSTMELKVRDELKKGKAASVSTLTVRNIPADVDAAITAQAKAAGKSKSDFIQGFLSSTFGDIIGNFSRTSELVALMDRELSGATGLPLTENWYDGGHSLTENREYCRLLEIHSEEDLQRIMLSAVPWLTRRVRQLDTGIPMLPHGISMTCALFIEAASRDYQLLDAFHRHLFWYVPEEKFRADVDEIRKARLMPPAPWPAF